MSHLEPTYLRFIHDGILNGSIHKDNAADLPDGLIGLYEEAFDDGTSVIERQKLLQRFAIWALLKKEVSVAFIAEILGEPENEIQAFISNYSAWFNSPESGKYQLYHERLKVFLLQKMNEVELYALHVKIIARLEWSIEAKKADEFELYSLEFLSLHLGVEAMISGNGSKLLKFAYAQTNWQRQLKISKGYTWTKISLNAVMPWASKYNQNEVIECALQLVDLNFQMQNAAYEIVALVSEGAIDYALKRIEEFGSNNEHGLQRKFILYMLCLMELTLLESKDKPFRKEGIEKIFRHLDEHLPIDHSVLNWNDFFPSYLLYEMACEWVQLALNFTIVLKRTDSLNLDWVSEIGPYSALQFEVLITCVRDMNDEVIKCGLLGIITTEMAKQGKIEEAICCISNFVDVRDKFYALTDMITELSKHETHYELSIIFQEALNCVQNFKSIHEEYSNNKKKVNQGTIDDANSFLDSKKINSHLKLLTYELINKGMIEEATNCALGISNGMEKSFALMGLFANFANKGRMQEAEEILEEAFACARGIKDDSDRVLALIDISRTLAKQGQIKKAETVIQEALVCAQAITDESDKCGLISEIAIALSKQGKAFDSQQAMQYAITCARGISYYRNKIRALRSIAVYLAELGQDIEANTMIQEIITLANISSSERERSWALGGIAVVLAEQGKITEALSCARDIIDESGQSKALMGISVKLANQDKVCEAEIIIKEAIASAQRISDMSEKCSLLLEIVLELNKLKMNSLSETIMMDAIYSANKIVDESEKGFALQEIIVELANMGKLTLAINTGFQISHMGMRQKCWQKISKNHTASAGWKSSLNLLSQFQDVELKTFFIHGLTNEIFIKDCDEKSIAEILVFTKYDSESMEIILHKNALYELFFGDAQTSKIKRFDRTFNLNWAIEFKNHLTINV
jgi:tetratricopeptide (TPR) repeat protein